MLRSLFALVIGASLLSAVGDARAQQAVDVGAGYGVTCVVTSAGAARCWGRNESGQLGDGTTTDRLEPAAVSTLSSGVAALSPGGEYSVGHTCARTTAGNVRCWGSNANWGQVGDASGVNRSTPVEIDASGAVVAMSAGSRHTCTVWNYGSARCWGDNYFGQAGVNAPDWNFLTPTPVADLANAVGISAGGSHTCALRAGGALKCWGYNLYGQLGINEFSFNRPTPVEVLGLQAGVAAVSAGGTHTCALTSAGGVKCWGDNSYGQLGDGTTLARPSAVDVAGLSSGVVAISAGGNHTCALTSAGGVKCWGANYEGQLGKGNFDFGSSVPVDVSGLSSGVAAIGLGYEHTCAVSVSGGASCWGDNSRGQLGNGSTLDSPVPAQVSGFVAGSQTISFPELPGRILADGPFTVSATASSGLPVAFSSLTPSTCSLSGNVVSPLATGTCTIAANQAGDATYSPAPQVTRSFEIRVLSDDAPPVGLTAIRRGDQLSLKWRAEAAFSGYEVSCDGGATIDGHVIPVVVSTTTALVTAPDRTRSYRCEVRAVGTGEITAAGRPAFSQAYSLRELGFLGSLAIGDFDNNGLPELLGTLAGPNGLAVTSEADLGLGTLRSPNRAYRDVRIADLDADGYNDIIANVYSPLSNTDSFTRLYWGGPNGFVEDLAFAQRKIRGYGETIVVADFDNDGDLDIFIPFYTDNEPAEQNVLLVNDGNRGFLEQADARGVANRNWFSNLRVEGCQGVDFDGDGWIDIYCGSHLYKNTGGSFTDVREAVGLPLQLEEGAKFVDWNRDGRLDLVLQTIDPTPQGIIRLFEYDGARFVERSSVVTNAPVSRTRYGFFAADLDGDGTEDLLVPGGFDFTQSNVPTILLLNRGDGFEPTDFLPSAYRVTHADGLVASAVRQRALNDIFIPNGSMSMLESLIPDRPFVRIEVLDAQGRRNQHGRVVTLTDPDPRLGKIAKAVDGGSGYMSQSDYPVTFAIAEGVASVQVEVRFASGVVTAQAPAGKTLAIHEDGRAVVRPAATALSVSRSGDGTGAVSSSPIGIQCGRTCYAVFDQGAAVTLTATPASGSIFAGWSGACTGTAPCSVTMDAAKNVTATFRLQPFALVVSKEGPGSGLVTSVPAGIDCGPTCSASFMAGTAVTLTAAAANGSVFTGWSGGGCSGTGTCTVTIDGAKSVTASFALQSLVLTTSLAGAGTGVVTSSPAGIQCGATCSAGFAFGTVVTLTASAAGGSVFAGWSGAGCSGTGTCVLTIDAAKAVTATFVKQPVQLSVLRTGAGTGTIVSSPLGIDCGATCAALFDMGAVVTLSATPAAGSVFTGWGGACSGDAACVVTLDAAKSVTANFALQFFTLSVQKNGAGTGVVASSPGGIDCGTTCSASYGSGSVVTLNAAAGSGSVFAGWSGGGCTGQGACTVTVMQATTVTALFGSETPRIGGLSTRMMVGTGDNVMIAGFIIGGSTPKTVAVRARGPSLPVAGALADPVLTLVPASGAASITNDDWQTAANAAALLASGFAPADAKESAILATLQPGAYTALVTGGGNTRGVGIVEVYEVDTPENPLIGIATRGQVLSGDSVMIGGFTIDGSMPRTVVVRARGPSLQGVPGTLGNPILQLVDAATGAVTVNDDWGTAANAAALQASGFAPPDARESALLVTLNPGAYTAIVSGFGGSGGIAILEIYVQ